MDLEEPDDGRVVDDILVLAVEAVEVPAVGVPGE